MTDDARTLAAEIAVVRAELGRADTKAGLLLTVPAATLAVAGSALGAPMSPIRTGAVVVALAGAVVAGWFLLAAVRPNLTGRYGLMAYSGPDADPAAVHDAVSFTTLRAISAAAVRKYRHLQRAVLAVRVTLAAAVVAQLAALW